MVLVRVQNRMLIRRWATKAKLIVLAVTKDSTRKWTRKHAYYTSKLCLYFAQVPRLCRKLSLKAMD